MRQLLYAMASVGILFQAGIAAAEDPPGAYMAPSPEPTPAETLMLEYLNRARANPAGEIEPCLGTSGIPGDFDHAMFASEMQEFAPTAPLCFDLSLLKAARWHSFYMGFNEQTHDETPGAEGFAGASMSGRIRQAGFEGNGMGENIYQTAKDPWFQQAAFLIDWGEGPGGMQPGRGHRVNMLNGSYRLVGLGAVPHPDGSSTAVTADFGTSDTRYVGGVVYRDADRDRFYDIGEGIGGLAIAQGNNRVESWGSGAYTLSIGRQEGWLEITLEDKLCLRYIPAGEENIKIDVIPNDSSQFVSAAKLLQDFERLEGTARFKQLIDLDIQMSTVFLHGDAQECEELLALVREVRQEVSADQEKLRTAVKNCEIEAVLNLCQDTSQRYRGTPLLPWFNDAATCTRMRASYLEVAELAAADRLPGTAAMSRKMRTLERLFSQVTTAEWLEYAQAIGEAFVLLGGSGDINQEFTAQGPLPEDAPSPGENVDAAVGDSAEEEYGPSPFGPLDTEKESQEAETNEEGETEYGLSPFY